MAQADASEWKRNSFALAHGAARTCRHLRGFPVRAPDLDDLKPGGATNLAVVRMFRSQIGSALTPQSNEDTDKPTKPRFSHVGIFSLRREVPLCFSLPSVFHQMIACPLSRNFRMLYL